MSGCTISIASSSHLRYLCTSECDRHPKFWWEQQVDFFNIGCFGYGRNTSDDRGCGRFFSSGWRWEGRGGVVGIDAGIFCVRFNRIFFWIFLELLALSELRCFTPGSFNDPLVTTSSQLTPPLWGSCLWPGVPLDHLMGWCSLLAIFTHLVSCWQQDGGGAVCSILKLWDHFDWKNETVYDGLESELIWWDEALSNEFGGIIDMALLITIFCWLYYCENEALSYEIFMWGDVGIVTDVRFYGVAPHWYFRPFMAWLIACPYHKTGILGLLLLFFLLFIRKEKSFTPYQPGLLETQIQTLWRVNLWAGT